MQEEAKYRCQSRSLVVAAAVVGVGLSGFFDGILLHQILQWHHLLSLVPGETFRDLGTQILADGLFHVLMYAVTTLGLWLLWRQRSLLSEGGSARLVGGGAIAGFGIWNLIDVGFFHWILGIHRIRLNVPDPLAYDVGWLILLGIVPAAIGWLILRKAGPGDLDRSRSGSSAGATLAVLAIVAAPVAALPQRGSNTAVVLFVPGTSAGMAVNAVMSAGGRILWAHPDGRMMAVALERPGASGRLYRSGALFVTRSPALAGCAAAAA